MTVSMFCRAAILSVVVLAVIPFSGRAQAVPVSPTDGDGLAESGHGGDYCQRRLGTWFYCEAPPRPQPNMSSGPAAAPAKDDQDIAAAEAFKARMERARLIAVWNPTEENIRRYYGYQQATLKKSGLFADTARRLVWSDPSLDYTLERPIGQAAKTAWQDVRTADRDLFFRGAFDQIGLFYLYRGRCAPCRTASPIVRAFGQRYGITVRPISIDGAPNPDFADFVTNRGQLKAWGISEPVTPAYLIYQKPSLDAQGRVRPVAITVSDGKQIVLRACPNPKGCLTYLGAGVLTVDELADRLFVILGTEPGKDF